MRTGCAFSLTVCSPLITILVLDLEPSHADPSAPCCPLWPTGSAYAVSYVFIAIVWVNHHHCSVMPSRRRRAGVVRLRASFLGITDPVCHRMDCRYQAGRGPGRAVCRHIVLVNVTYLALGREALGRDGKRTPASLRRPFAVSLPFRPAEHTPQRDGRALHVRTGHHQSRPIRPSSARASTRYTPAVGCAQRRARRPVRGRHPLPGRHRGPRHRGCRPRRRTRSPPATTSCAGSAPELRLGAHQRLGIPRWADDLKALAGTPIGGGMLAMPNRSTTSPRRLNGSQYPDQFARRTARGWNASPRSPRPNGPSGSPSASAISAVTPVSAKIPPPLPTTLPLYHRRQGGPSAQRDRRADHRLQPAQAHRGHGRLRVGMTGKICLSPRIGSRRQ